MLSSIQLVPAVFGQFHKDVCVTSKRNMLRFTALIFSRVPDRHQGGHAVLTHSDTKCCGPRVMLDNF